METEKFERCKNGLCYNGVNSASDQLSCDENSDEFGDVAQTIDCITNTMNGD